jgi:hypothetical protein
MRLIRGSSHPSVNWYPHEREGLANNVNHNAAWNLLFLIDFIRGSQVDLFLSKPITITEILVHRHALA